MHCARAVHVQIVVFLPPLQVKWWAPLTPEVQVTCLLSPPICFCGYRSCEVQAARARTEKVYLRGVLRF